MQGTQCYIHVAMDLVITNAACYLCYKYASQVHLLAAVKQQINRSLSRLII